MRRDWTVLAAATSTLTSMQRKMKTNAQSIPISSQIARMRECECNRIRCYAYHKIVWLDAEQSAKVSKCYGRIDFEPELGVIMGRCNGRSVRRKGDGFQFPEVVHQ